MFFKTVKLVLFFRSEKKTAIPRNTQARHHRAGSVHLLQNIWTGNAMYVYQHLLVGTICSRLRLRAGRQAGVGVGLWPKKKYSEIFSHLHGAHAHWPRFIPLCTTHPIHRSWLSFVLCLVSGGSYNASGSALSTAAVSVPSREDADSSREICLFGFAIYERGHFRIYVGNSNFDTGRVAVTREFINNVDIKHGI